MESALDTQVTNINKLKGPPFLHDNIENFSY